MIDWIVSQTGIVAAVLVLLAFAGGIQTLLRPWLDRRGARPRLYVTPPDISELAEWGRLRELRFHIGNSAKGTAIVGSLRLLVSTHGESKEVRETMTSAPVTVHTHRVEISPDKAEYDVRGRLFGPEQPPLSFSEGEDEAFVVKVVSRDPHWYRIRIEAAWVDVATPDVPRTVATDELFLDFPGEVSALRSRSPG